MLITVCYRIRGVDVIKPPMSRGWLKRLFLPSFQGEPMSFKINKYDAAESLLRAPTSKIPDWDPVFGILRAVNGSNTTAITKYDPAAAALKGSWQKNDSSLDIAPKWDPIFGIRNAVNDPTPIKSNR